MKVNIGVLGSKNASKGNLAIAKEVGREIARAGAVLICGARGGIMRAAAEGCREAGGLAIGIIPCLDKTDCDSDVLEVILPTSLGYGRNIFIASASDVVIAIDGNYGTLSEIAFALNYGRKVIVIEGTGGTADFMKSSPYEIYLAKNPKDAVQLAMKLAGQKS